jgi:hypothetical protein
MGLSHYFFNFLGVDNFILFFIKKQQIIRHVFLKILATEGGTKMAKTQF